MTDSPLESPPETGAGHALEHRDDVGAKIGMWLFLYTELVLFSGMFILYAMYLVQYRQNFIAESKHLSLASGAVNTLFLLTSSLTMALSISALRLGRKRMSIGCLAGTIAFALGFFVVKYFEWTHKFHAGIYPDSPTLDAMGHGATMFYALYFIMTGLHALHVLIGVILLSVMLGLVVRGRVNADRFVALENSGLYWHLVDLIWIYLFPLFYLIR